MANAIYPRYGQSLLAADANVSLNQTGVNQVMVTLIDTGTYTYTATHQFYSDLTGIVGTAQSIDNITIVDGVINGDDVTFPSVTGNSVEALVIFRRNSGANTTWRLVEYRDTGVTGLPVTPNGGNITVTWNASGITNLLGGP